MIACTLKKKNALTLVELLITVFVLSIGILSTLLFFTNAMRSTEFARDITEATSHAGTVLEEMHTRETLANIAQTDWSAWSLGEGINTLPSESVTVAITNAAADPLDITVTVNWTRSQRQNTMSLKTRIH